LDASKRDAIGYAIDRATVRQKKTGRPVKFEMTDQTRQAVDDDLRAVNKKPDEFLFAGRRGIGHGITTRHFRPRRVQQLSRDVGCASESGSKIRVLSSAAIDFCGLMASPGA